MDFVSAMDAPIIKEIKGADVSFPVWTMAEIAALCARLMARKLTSAEKEAERLELPAMETVTLLGHIRLKGITPWDVMEHFQTVEGATECLRTSLTKAGQSLDVLEHLTVIELAEMARLVGRIVAQPLPKGATNPPVTTADPATG